jgi:hypothetical protein
LAGSGRDRARRFREGTAAQLLALLRLASKVLKLLNFWGFGHAEKIGAE